MTSITRPSMRVEEFLGPAESRFFSNGYRRVDYDFGEVFLNALDGSSATLTTNVSMRYPVDWSTKAAGALRPHLSTVDAILLGVQMSDLCLTHAFALDAERRRRMWVKSIRIKAGTAPAEELAQVGVAARLEETRPGPGGTMISDLTCQIGTMRARCEVTHPAAVLVTGAARHADPAELLGPAGNRYYGTGFSRGGQVIEDVVLDVPTAVASAAISIDPADGADHGFGGAYQPGATPVDCFVTSMQLAQVLLYALDSIERADSNTLWMRATAIEVAGPAQPVMDRLHLITSLQNTGLHATRDAVWRTADVIARLGQISVTCAVAHQLPSGQFPPATPTTA